MLPDPDIAVLKCLLFEAFNANWENCYAFSAQCPSQLIHTQLTTLAEYNDLW